MDIIVTTPKSQMENARREAADVKAAGGGEYFRRFHSKPPVHPGERVYYVEDGYVRGFALVDRVEHHPNGMRCESTGRFWQYGWYVFMDAACWCWIEPVAMTGFQNFRLAHMDPKHRLLEPKIVGGWLDPKPEV